MICTHVRMHVTTVCIYHLIWPKNVWRLAVIICKYCMRFINYDMHIDMHAVA